MYSVCGGVYTLVWLPAQRAVLLVLSLSFIESLSSHANELTPGRGVRTGLTDSPPSTPSRPAHVVAKQLPEGSAL